MAMQCLITMLYYDYKNRKLNYLTSALGIDNSYHNCSPSREAQQTCARKVAIYSQSGCMFYLLNIINGPKLELCQLRTTCTLPWEYIIITRTKSKFSFVMMIMTSVYDMYQSVCGFACCYLHAYSISGVSRKYTEQFLWTVYVPCENFAVNHIHSNDVITEHAQQVYKASDLHFEPDTSADLA